MPAPVSCGLNPGKGCVGSLAALGVTYPAFGNWTIVKGNASDSQLSGVVSRQELLGQWQASCYQKAHVYPPEAKGHWMLH